MAEILCFVFFRLSLPSFCLSHSLTRGALDILSVICDKPGLLEAFERARAYVAAQREAPSERAVREFVSLRDRSHPGV